MGGHRLRVVAKPFEVVVVDEWERGEREPGGDDEKRWFTAPIGSPFAGHWLFKPRTVTTLELSKARKVRGDKPEVLVTGEDWSEKVSYELAVLLDLPAAVTELATVVRAATGERVWGSMSRDIRPRDWPRDPGAMLLTEVDPEFDSESCVGHTLEAVHAVLSTEVAGPVRTRYESWSAFDVWAGYLLLDAWVANTDRHAHNWCVLQDPASGATHLGASYDHGTGLWSGATEKNRADRVNHGTVDEWCARGRTRRFYGGEPRSLVDLAAEAISMTSATAQTHWRARLTGVDLDECSAIVDRTPNMSDLTRTFVRSVITTNRKRLCDALH